MEGDDVDEMQGVDETLGLELGAEEASGYDAVPVKVSKRDIEKQLAQEAREQKQRRESKLKALREQQQSRAEAASAAGADNRLAFLMQQAELFTHFVHGDKDKPAGGGGAGAGAAEGGGAGGAGAGAAASSSSTAGMRGRRGKKEAAEGEELGASARLPQARGWGGGLTLSFPHPPSPSPPSPTPPPRAPPPHPRPQTRPLWARA